MTTGPGHHEQTTPSPAGMPVVAGVDGSAEALTAAEVAAGEARRRRVPLVLTHAFTWPLIWPPLTEEYHPTDPLPRAKAHQLLARAAEHLRDQGGAEGGPEVQTRLVDGHAAATLVDASRAAALVVVGHRGSGGFTQLLAGSVAIHTAAHAYSPVMIVRGKIIEPGAPIILGFDGSTGARLGAEFAFATAARRGAPVTVVTVWPTDRTWPDAVAAAGYPTPPARAVLDSLGDLPSRYPDVPVRVEVVAGGSTAAALAGAADAAGLVVVGSRGFGGLRGLLLGSVGRALIEHAPCPVAIVRPRA
jgi:nucleotide-binding universal stress UspA family protein